MDLDPDKPSQQHICGRTTRTLNTELMKVDISVSMHATCTGMIQGINQLVNILWDTGATQCLISGKMVE